MPCTMVHLNSRLVFQWWSEYWSANQMVIRILSNYVSGHLKSKPFYDQKIPMIRLPIKFTVKIHTIFKKVKLIFYQYKEKLWLLYCQIARVNCFEKD